MAHWIEDYDLDGLRLDAADVIDPEFLKILSAFCRERRSDFWLMGEVIHGNYAQWAPGAGLDSVTNYELYKGLWSSHNDGNYFELAWSLNRQFGPEGLYRGQNYYNFADNHDVDRIASTLGDPGYLYPHAILTATVPGIPSVYYGSEVGSKARKPAPATNRCGLICFPVRWTLFPSSPLRVLWSRLAGFGTACRPFEPATISRPW